MNEYRKKIYNNRIEKKSRINNYNNERKINIKERKTDKNKKYI